MMTKLYNIIRPMRFWPHREILFFFSSIPSFLLSLKTSSLEKHFTKILVVHSSKLINKSEIRLFIDMARLQQDHVYCNFKKLGTDLFLPELECFSDSGKCEAMKFVGALISKFGHLALVVLFISNLVATMLQKTFCMSILALQ